MIIFPPWTRVSKCLQASPKTYPVYNPYRSQSLVIAITETPTALPLPFIARCRLRTGKTNLKAMPPGGLEALKKLIFQALLASGFRTVSFRESNCKVMHGFFIQHTRGYYMLLQLQSNSRCWLGAVDNGFGVLPIKPFNPMAILWSSEVSITLGKVCQVCFAWWFCLFFCIPFLMINSLELTLKIGWIP